MQLSRRGDCDHDLGGINLKITVNSSFARMTSEFKPPEVLTVLRVSVSTLLQGYNNLNKIIL